MLPFTLFSEMCISFEILLVTQCLKIFILYPTNVHTLTSLHFHEKNTAQIFFCTKNFKILSNFILTSFHFTKKNWRFLQLLDYTKNSQILTDFTQPCFDIPSFHEKKWIIFTTFRLHKNYQILTSFYFTKKKCHIFLYENWTFSTEHTEKVDLLH